MTLVSYLPKSNKIYLKKSRFLSGTLIQMLLIIKFPYTMKKMNGF